MRVTLRLDSVCLSAQLLPEDAIAIVQEVGRSAVRQIDDGRTAVVVPCADDVRIDSYGDVGWDHAALVAPDLVVDALGRLLESLLRIAEDADQYHFTPAVSLIIARAIGAPDADPFASPLEFLRTLDRLGPIDNNAAIRALYQRWERTPHKTVAIEIDPGPAAVEVRGSRETSLLAGPRSAPAPAHLSRKDVRELMITTLAAVASTVLFVPVLMGMTPSPPARAATAIAARDLRMDMALPPAPLPARRPTRPARAATRGARVTAAPAPLVARDRLPATAMETRDDRASNGRRSRAADPRMPRTPRSTSILTRVLAGDRRRHPIQPFPRPTGLD